MRFHVADPLTPQPARQQARVPFPPSRRRRNRCGGGGAGWPSPVLIVVSWAISFEQEPRSPASEVFDLEPASPYRRGWRSVSVFPIPARHVVPCEAHFPPGPKRGTVAQPGQRSGWRRTGPCAGSSEGRRAPNSTQHPEPPARPLIFTLFPGNSQCLRRTALGRDSIAPRLRIP